MIAAAVTPLLGVTTWGLEPVLEQETSVTFTSYPTYWGGVFVYVHVYSVGHTSTVRGMSLKVEVEVSKPSAWHEGTHVALDSLTSVDVCTPAVHASTSTSSTQDCPA